ncbi:hypothetical protein HMPREF1547_00359 [Blautia sp. KLE 1732]|nr:hypothetical protein HMPREF1547_00359 [Blautia sp. KLE 1732]
MFVPPACLFGYFCEKYLCFFIKVLIFCCFCGAAPLCFYYVFMILPKVSLKYIL